MVKPVSPAVGRVEAAMVQAVRDAGVEPDPAAVVLLIRLATRMYQIFTSGGALDDTTVLDDTALNAVGFTAARYAVLGVQELRALDAAGAPFREEVTVKLPESYRREARARARRPATRPDFWPGPVGYAVALHEAVREAETELDGGDARTFYLMGLRVAAGLYGLPDGVDGAVRREWAGKLDLMPVFVIKGKDRFAGPAIAAYRDLCVDAGLDDQAVQVCRAYAETVGWQRRHPELVRAPSHTHVPVGG